MDLPAFRYHPNPLASGSVILSDALCVACGQHRGAIYTGPVYAENDEDYDNAICPWCIADRTAHERLDGAVFVDTEAFLGEIPDKVADHIAQRTPGFASWQSEQWPVCCQDATAFLAPVGIAEVRRDHYEWEGFLMSHIVYDRKISGGAATRLLNSLNKETGPTAYAFTCLHCHAPHFYIDSP